MALKMMLFLVLPLGCAFAAPSIEAVVNEKQAVAFRDVDQEKDDLKTAASNTHVARRFSDWGGAGGGYQTGYNGYSVTGYGTLDDKYNYAGSGGYGGYDSFGSGGYAGYPGYKGYSGGYGNGYGGYGGNGGLNSYYGYNNPNSQGAYHLGYGYYKRPGYGNIYSNGITPNLVTGYRGYSRR